MITFAGWALLSCHCQHIPSREATASDSLGRKSQESSRSYEGSREVAAGVTHQAVASFHAVASRLQRNSLTIPWDLRPRLIHVTASQLQHIGNDKAFFDALR